MSDKEPPRQAPFPALDSCLGWLSVGAAAQSHGPALGPPLQAASLTWSQLDLQCSPDKGHQRGCEVDGHVVIGDGHVHTNQALGIRGQIRPGLPGFPGPGGVRWIGVLPAFTLSLDPDPHLS